MDIFITSSIGQGSTEIAAFDAALREAGIANTNLIPLSSVIPPKSTLRFEKPTINTKQFGNRLYLVKVENRSSVKGAQIAAGIGWVLEKNNAFGLFVEHVGKTKNEVSSLIKKSLQDMVNGRPEYKFSQVNMQIEETVCVDQSVCVLVCAVYKLEGWS